MAGKVPSPRERSERKGEGHRLIQSAGFPEPVFRINCGRVPVWRASEIEAWEKGHPEVFSDTAKLQKQIWYFRAVSRG